jgi:transcriptional regulator with XRE-family HTH domain
MVRKTAGHVTTESAAAATLAPKYMTKREFATNLNTLMVRKGWYQSELARHAGIAKDSVSTYIRGVAFPTPRKLDALAKALGVKPEQLLPNGVIDAMVQEESTLELKMSPGSTSVAWLRINRAVSMGAAVQIMAILEKENAPDGA